MRLHYQWPGSVTGPQRSVAVIALCIATWLLPPVPASAREEPPQEPPKTPPQSQPAEPGATTKRDWVPQTKFINRREMMRQWLIDQGKDPDEIMKPKIRYEKGSFMITGSIEISTQLYDDDEVVDRWIEQLESIWKERLPVAAKMGNPGRVTFKVIITRKDGFFRLDIIEPSGLDSFDQAAQEVMEDSKSLFSIPEDFPSDWATVYLKFHYNIFSEL